MSQDEIQAAMAKAPISKTKPITAACVSLLLLSLLFLLLLEVAVSWLLLLFPLPASDDDDDDFEEDESAATLPTLGPSPHKVDDMNWSIYFEIRSANDDDDEALGIERG
jgi:hypothetical protein